MQCAQIRQEHVRDTSKYKAEIEGLRKALQLKSVTEQTSNAGNAMPAEPAHPITCVELLTSSESSAFKTPPRAHDEQREFESQVQPPVCHVFDSALCAADAIAPDEARSGIASAREGAKMQQEAESDSRSDGGANPGTKNSPMSSATSVGVSGSLYSSISEVGDNRSVSSMRSGRSTRSSVWVSCQTFHHCLEYKADWTLYELRSQHSEYARARAHRTHANVHLLFNV